MSCYLYYNRLNRFFRIFLESLSYPERAKRKTQFEFWSSNRNVILVCRIKTLHTSILSFMTLTVTVFGYHLNQQRFLRVYFSMFSLVLSQRYCLTTLYTSRLVKNTPRCAFNFQFSNTVFRVLHITSQQHIIFNDAIFNNAKQTWLRGINCNRHLTVYFFIYLFQQLFHPRAEYF